MTFGRGCLIRVHNTAINAQTLQKFSEQVVECPAPCNEIISFGLEFDRTHMMTFARFGVSGRELNIKTRTVFDMDNN